MIICIAFAVGRSEDVGSLFFVSLFIYSYLIPYIIIVIIVPFVKNSLEYSSSPLGRRMKQKHFICNNHKMNYKINNMKTIKVR